MTLKPKLVQPKRLLALLASVTCASVLLAACVEEPPPVTPTEPLNVVINEVESSGGMPGDWVELYNAGTQTADISGLYFKDDNDNRTYQIPAGTTIAPGEFYVLEEADFDFGLGGADQARLFDTDGVTLLDSYTWESHAATTYGRCPDGVGEFQETTTPTKGAANNCEPVEVDAEIFITEYMYNGTYEFVELTNLGATPVDFTGWKYNDEKGLAGAHDLSSFGVVEVGESVIVTETTPAVFSANWNLCEGIKVIGNTPNGLGRADTITIFDAAETLIDSLTYGDQTFPGSIRTNAMSGWVSEDGLGANDPYAWTLSTVGDAEGSYLSNNNEIGSPGYTSFAPDFEPCTPSTPAPVITTSHSELGHAIGASSNPDLTLTVSHGHDDVDSLVVTATSSNTDVLPVENIDIPAVGGTRVVGLDPIARGATTLVFTVTDAHGATSTTTVLYGASTGVAGTSGRYLHGTSDASAALDVGDGHAIVVDDESNTIALFNVETGGEPVTTWTFSSAELGTSSEIDFEGIARSGDLVVITGSHGNNRSGAVRTERRTLIGLEISGAGASTELTFAGRYTNLWNDLRNWDSSNGHGLGANALGFLAATAPGVEPNPPVGFNIEALEFAPDGDTLYLGFRAPTVGGDALIVPVTNAAALLEGTNAAGPATFDAPLFVDLEGRSIRSIASNDAGDYVISAGPSPANNTWALYLWDGQSDAAPVLSGLLPSDDGVTRGAWESIAYVPSPLVEGSTITMLTDSGDTNFYGTGAAKDQPVGLRKFLGIDMLITLAPAM